MNIENIRISTIIVTWNNHKTIKACLRSLLTETMIKQQIIVVDNASSDQTIDVVGEVDGSIQIIKNKHNAGFAVALNQGLQEATGELILILNPDTTMVAGSLRLLVNRLINDAQVMVVGPQLLNPDNAIQASGRRLPSLSSVWLNTFCPNRWKQSRWYYKKIFGRVDFNQEAIVQEVSGACFITKRSSIDKVGLFDDRFFLYFEETDWFKRLSIAHGQVIYYPKAQVIHHWGHSMAQNKFNTDLEYFKSQTLYWKKHFSWWQQGLLLDLLLIYGLTAIFISVITFKSPNRRKHYFNLIKMVLTTGWQGKTNG